jgi:hypothetical protein
MGCFLSFLEATIIHGVPEHYIFLSNPMLEPWRQGGNIEGLFAVKGDPNSVNSQSKTVLSVELCRGCLSYWSHA